MTDYTEREVRAEIAGMQCAIDNAGFGQEGLATFASYTIGNIGKWKCMLTQLADMLAEREKAEPVYQRRHVDSHTWVDCSPEEYKIWHENNRRILYTHPAAQESGR